MLQKFDLLNCIAKRKILITVAETLTVDAESQVEEQAKL